MPGSSDRKRGTLGDLREGIDAAALEGPARGPKEEEPLDEIHPAR